MATVPVYDLPTQQLNAGGMTPAQAPEFQNYTGKQIEAIGKVASTAGETMFKIGADIQNKYDDARTKDLFNQASAEIDQIRNEYGTKTGKAAVDSYATYQLKIQDVLKSHAQKAENPVQRGMFDSSSSVMARSALSTMNNHQLQQLHEYDLGETAASVKRLAQTAVAMNGTPDEQKFLLAAINNVNQLADLKGYAADSEQRKDLVSDTNDAIVKGVVDNMMAAGNPSQAKEFLADATKDGRVSEFMHATLEKLVVTDAAKDKALRLSLSLSGSESVQLKQLDEMYKSKKLTQEEHDFATSYVEHRFAQRRTEDQDNKKIMTGRVEDWILKNPGVPITAMPAAYYNFAKSEALLPSFDSFARTHEYANDPSSYNEAMTMTNQQYQKMTYAEFFNKYRPKLNNTSWNEAESRWNSANGKGSTEGTHIITNADLVKKSAVSMGIISSTQTMTGEEQQKLFEFQTIVDSNIKAWENANGGKPAPQEAVRKILDQLNLDKVSQGGWFRPNVQTTGVKELINKSSAFYVVQPNAQNKLKAPVTVKFADIPADMLAMIEETLASRGTPVTTQNIASAWAIMKPSK